MIWCTTRLGETALLWTGCPEPAAAAVEVTPNAQRTEREAGRFSARGVCSELCAFLWDTKCGSTLAKWRHLPCPRRIAGRAEMPNVPRMVLTGHSESPRTVCKEKPLALPSGAREDQHLPFLSAPLPNSYLREILRTVIYVTHQDCSSRPIPNKQLSWNLLFVRRDKRTGPHLLGKPSPLELSLPRMSKQPAQMSLRPRGHAAPEATAACRGGLGCEPMTHTHLKGLFPSSLLSPSGPTEGGSPPKPAQLLSSTFICMDKAPITSGFQPPKPRSQDRNLKCFFLGIPSWSNS